MCRCTSGYDSRRCTCVKSGKPCTTDCRCQCCHNPLHSIQRIHPSFTTTEAQDFWDAIPSHFQERVLHNVWCPHERDMTTMADDFWGEIQGITLVLHGTCVRCEGRVARVLEGEPTLTPHEVKYGHRRRMM